MMWATDVAGGPIGCTVEGAPTRVRREVRWILEGRVRVALRPSGRPRRRRDRYDLDTLTPWHAAKRRGSSATLEHKVRTGRVEHGRWSGVDGFVETWRKGRVHSDRDVGTWVAVDKQLWSFGHVEVCHFSVGRTGGWTVCIDVGRLPTPAGTQVLDLWLPELARRGAPDSYPSWLVGHRAEIRA